ncbi:hypothetical protein [Pseudomonas migulae]|uniref:Uncharacterized protein n=1 Tax=Pseudomonas migulae TaxID=78543 RepID=A0ABY8MS23_9PSED|nr:hypothetical protein [Pseudomonas migulae]WGK89276.1 hypothetical protein MOQ58_22495 [Pseudomonas migulae]
MFTKRCKTFPNRQEYASGLAIALQSELGSTHQAVKTLMRWTNANERTAKNWLKGTCGPRGEHLARLIQHSDAALASFLDMAERNSAVMRTTLPSLRSDLMRAVNAIDCCLSAVNEP